MSRSRSWSRSRRMGDATHGVSVTGLAEARRPRRSAGSRDCRPDLGSRKPVGQANGQVSLTGLANDAAQASLGVDARPPSLANHDRHPRSDQRQPDSCPSATPAAPAVEPARCDRVDPLRAGCRDGRGGRSPHIHDAVHFVERVAAAARPAAAVSSAWPARPCQRCRAVLAEVVELVAMPPQGDLGLHCRVVSAAGSGPASAPGASCRGGRACERVAAGHVSRRLGDGPTSEE